MTPTEDDPGGGRGVGHDGERSVPDGGHGHGSGDEHLGDGSAAGDGNHSDGSDSDDDRHGDGAHGPGGGHDHGPGGGHGPGPTSTRTLALVAGLNLAGFLAELAGGLLFGSVALLSDAVHMLFDALAYVMAYAAAALAERSDTSGQWSYGLHRLEPLSAFLNGALLVPMVLFILWESYRRVLSPVEVGTGPTLALAVAGLLVNLVSVYLLGGGGMSLNERGAFYHLLGDAGGSVAVIVATVAVDLTGVRVLDPVAAVLIAGAVAWSAGKLLQGSGAIFLHRSPVERDEVRDALRGAEGVDDVVDLHVWQICSRITVASTHVRTSAETVEAARDVTDRVHGLLAEFGVDHATVELVFEDGRPGGRLAAHVH